MKNEILIIGIILSLGVGFTLGALSTSRQIPAPQTSTFNYDPARAIVGDTLKSLQESNQQCWTHVQELLIERAKTAH